jgi:DNA-binding NarL/FixJ family response regulator
MPETASKHIRIFIIDPYAMIRAGLRLIIESEPGMEVVGEAGDTGLGLDQIARKKPDIILFKINPLGNPNLDDITRVLETWGQGRIILLTTSDDIQTCAQAVQQGVLGIVSKTQPTKTLIQAIKKVHEGEVWIERSMMAYLLNTRALGHRAALLDPEAKAIATLSKREREVIKFIGLGYKNKQIAEVLSIQETTVRHHLTSIYGKLGVTDRLELLVFAQRNKMI